jgi:transposase
MNNKNKLIDYETKIEKLESENSNLKTEVAELKILNNWYIEQLRLANLKRFGSTSEKTDNIDQLSFFNEAENLADENIPEPKLEEITYKCKKRVGKREELYEGLPIRQIVHELPEEQQICGSCGENLHACGHEVLRRELEIIPAQVQAVEHVQTVYSCRSCEKYAAKDKLSLIKSAVPRPVIPNSGIASASLVSLVLCNKFVLALPIYRQAQELERIGAKISKQTLSNWIIYVAMHWLILIYNLLHSELLSQDIGHADETTVQVINEEGRKSTQKSYMWLYRTGKDSARPVILLDYQQTRHGKHPLKFLEKFEGYLHVDAYAGYRKLENQNVTLVECWSHARRKFDEALKAMDKKDRAGSIALIGFDYCNKLFKLEDRYTKLELDSEERFKRRLLESKPIAEAFFKWAEPLVPGTHSKSKIGRALRYAVNQQPRLMNFFLDGRLEISNNLAENAVRPFAVGRKNWLFIYSEKGANASAIAYSIVQTAQANGLVPFMYLNYLLQELPNIKTGQQISDYLPWNPEVQKICSLPVHEPTPS